MRIKINDKIYRLKEIESGVDSLMELVEEPKYKHGDFLVKEYKMGPKFICILDRIGEDGLIYYHCYYSPTFNRTKVESSCGIGSIRDPFHKCLRYADDGEIKILIAKLSEIGKRWNDEKKRIEDIPVYKDGDFVVNDLNSILIFKEADGDRMFDHAYLPACGGLIIDKVASYDGIKRHATIEEEYRMIEALAEQGKRWNNDKKCVEDIPKRKFKAGDKVRIKDGISNKSQRRVYPYFGVFLAKYIGKVMTVKEYITNDTGEYITTDEAKRGDYHYGFAEDLLEPWSDEPKVGEWVIFWDHSPKAARVGVLTDIRSDAKCKYGVDGLAWWLYAVKWDGTKEHLEKVIKGEI